MATRLKQEKARKIYTALKRRYPENRTVLKYENPWECLVGVILSAQSTDKQVNKVTDALFNKYKTVGDYAKADRRTFERAIFSTGFYHQKAKYILGAAKRVQNVYGGTVPNTMAELLTLPGVARKTANVVLGNAFGVVEGIAVDTHVKRLSGRLGLSKNTQPEKIEQDLMELFPKSEWFRVTYVLIDHGRAVCGAKDPRCDLCPVSKLCPSAFKFPRFNK